MDKMQLAYAKFHLANCSARKTCRHEAHTLVSYRPGQFSTRSHRRRLTAAEIQEILDLARVTKTQGEIAAKLGLAQTTVGLHVRAFVRQGKL